MSFEWNLSSDDEEEGLEAFLERTASAAASNGDEPSGDADDTGENISQLLVPFAKLPEKSENDEGGTEDEDSVDWEDANDESDQDRKPPALDKHSLRAVTIDLNAKPESTEKRPAKKRRKIVRKFRFESLPQGLQTVLRNLHRTHLLSLVGHAHHVSQQCSFQTELSAIALSMVPERFWSIKCAVKDHSVPAPTLQQLKNFYEWFLVLVYEAPDRLRERQQANLAAGAPRARSRFQQNRSNKTSMAERQSKKSIQTIMNSATTPQVASPERLLDYLFYLSVSNSADPQLYDTLTQEWNSYDHMELFIAMTRALGWRTRYVMSMDPMSSDLNIHHPLLATSQNIFTSLANNHATCSSGSRKRKRSIQKHAASTPELSGEQGFGQMKDTAPNPVSSQNVGWAEVLCHDLKAKNHLRWIHVDVSRQRINETDKVEDIILQEQPAGSDRTKKALSFVLAVEHIISDAQSDSQLVKYTDVTPRYVKSFVESLRLRGVVRNKKSLSGDTLKRSWWSRTLKELNRPLQRPLKERGSQEDPIVLDEEEDALKPSEPFGSLLDVGDAIDEGEHEELRASANNETIPTSKAAFQTHPLFVIPSVLGIAEVLAPDAKKRIVGVFKGELVFRRSEVSTALPARKWPYQGRRVLESELKNPIKRVKARRKPVSKNFKALKSYGVGVSNDGSEERRAQDIQDGSEPLSDGMEDLYASWQTEPWSPAPVGPNDPIPVNEYKNVELELLNPGLVHIESSGASNVAKKLGIPYAPCLLGFEGHGGNRTPTIRGIVVHEHNQRLLEEACAEVTHYSLEEEHANRRRAVYKRWKQLMHGLLTKDRLEREYG